MSEAPVDPIETLKSNSRPVCARLARRRRRRGDQRGGRTDPEANGKHLRQGLRNRWFAPAEEFARLQIARLEHMILKLLARIQNGDLEAIDPALKIADRLDGHHGFMKAKRVTEQYGEEDRARLPKKVNEITDRLQPEQPAE
jgi:hypothetical protein